MISQRKGLIIIGIFLILAFMSGFMFRQFITLKSVVIRVGVTQNKLDYDLKSAINFISYQFEKQGYYVNGVSFGGNLYPSYLNNAAINLFVRGFEPFYDVRINKNKKNIFYVERFAHQYAEEFIGYDAYLTSQKKIKYNMPLHHINVVASGAVPRPLLKPDYQYDVLYIYEQYNSTYADFLRKRFKNVKIYGGMPFANLSDKEKEQELSKAKLVVYEMMPAGKDDEDFVSFAVYDILAYGRPLLTNDKLPLKQKFNNDVYLFSNQNDLYHQTLQIFHIPSHIREQKARGVREKLRNMENVSPLIL
jgi:hypothetical protein